MKEKLFLSLGLIVCVLIVGAFISEKTKGQDYFKQTPTVINKTLTLADTEYSQAIPQDTKKLLLQERSGARAVLYCYSALCTGTGSYMTLPAGSSKTVDDFNIANKTLYLRDPLNAATVVEMEVWQDE